MSWKENRLVVIERRLCEMDQTYDADDWTYLGGNEEESRLNAERQHLMQAVEREKQASIQLCTWFPHAVWKEVNGCLEWREGSLLAQVVEFHSGSWRAMVSESVCSVFCQRHDVAPGVALQKALRAVREQMKVMSIPTKRKQQNACIQAIQRFL